MPQTTDDAFDYESAIARCASGERAALESIYQRDCRALLGVALRIVRDRARAADALHDAFIKVWTRAASYDASLGSGRGWVYSVVRHTALNQVRDGAREIGLDEEAAAAVDAEQSMAAHAGATSAFELRAEWGRLEGCLDALPPARRDCIVLAYVEGCSHGEIAQRTSTPLGTVKAWLQRSMTALRECMT